MRIDRELSRDSRATPVKCAVPCGACRGCCQPRGFDSLGWEGRRAPVSLSHHLPEIHKIKRCIMGKRDRTGRRGSKDAPFCSCHQTPKWRPKRGRRAESQTVSEMECWGCCTLWFVCARTESPGSVVTMATDSVTQKRKHVTATSRRILNVTQEILPQVDENGRNKESDIYILLSVEAR